MILINLCHIVCTSRLGTIYGIQYLKCEIKRRVLIVFGVELLVVTV